MGAPSWVPTSVGNDEPPEGQFLNGSSMGSARRASWSLRFEPS